MSLSNPRRDGLILLILLAGMSLGINLAESAEEKEHATTKAQVITQTFEIRNLDLNEAKENIKELLSKGEHLGASVEEFTVLRSGKKLNFLAVKDTPQKLKEIAQILEQLEEKFAPVTVNLDFSDVPLNQVLSAIAHTSNLNIIGGEALAQKISVHLKDVPLEDVFDIILKSSGHTYVQEGEVLRIIPQAEAPLVTEVFELRFASAERIREAVAHLITDAGEVKVFSKFSEGQYSNILIVTDTLQSLQAVRDLVQKLDKKLRQVMIEVKFCEVTLNKDNELGIDWVIQASLSGASTETMLPIHQMGLRRLERPATLTEPDGDITLGTISFADFSATLHALDTETKINIISNPRIATRDGEEAKIVVGSRVPIPIYERHRETASLEVTGYQDEEVGVVLKVIPIINSDNTITLKLNPEVSEITDYTGPNNERPIISTREVATLFTVENGKTVVLGGLMQQTVNDTLRKVPLLGSIPLLGNLFRYQDDSEDRTELLIFITPHIIKGTEVTKNLD